jgi:hypothetical protein
MATPKAPAPKPAAAPKTTVAPAKTSAASAAALGLSTAPTAKAATKSTTTSSNQAQINALISGIMKSEAGLATALGGLVSGMSGGGSTAGGSTDQYYTSEGRSGTSVTGQNYIEGKPVSSAEFNTWLYGDKASSVGAVTNAVATTKAADATANLTATFNAYGLGGDIASSLAALVKKGYGADTISLIAQDPTSQDPLAIAYRARFSGNAGRIAKGLAPLTPAEYLATENSYATLAKQAGLPAGFYDNKASWASLIANDVSPSEVQSRVNLAKDVLVNTDPLYLEQMQNYYGLDQSHALAHLLDPTAALPVIQKQVDAVKFGAAAARAGVNQNLDTLNQISNMGISQAAATQAFGNVAAALPGMQSIASRYSEYGPAGTIEQSLLNQQLGTTSPGETQAQAEARIKRLQTQEASTFGGSSGASQQGQSLGVANQQGVQ